AVYRRDAAGDHREAAARCSDRPVFFRSPGAAGTPRDRGAHGRAGSGATVRAMMSGSAVRMPRVTRTRGKSLAVLPFVNAADPKLDYLTDGIAESIINSLSQLGTIRVVLRSVVFRYKGVQVDPSTIGAALNVRTILTGRLT